VARWSRAQWPNLPLYLGGFSFGAAVALSVAAELALSGLVTVSPALKRVGAARLPDCPWLLVQGDKDEIVDAQEVLAWARALPTPPTLAVLAGVGHFFHSRLRELDEVVAEFFASHFVGDESVE
jgi:alpha/beta superfamily hydrolase